MDIRQEAHFNKEMERGAQAEGVLKNTLVREAFAMIEEAIVNQWKDSPLGDFEGQAKIRLRLDAYYQFKKYFEDAITTGRLASQSVERERTLAARAKAAAREFRR